jgi:signal transduction histidine kinase
MAEYALLPMHVAQTAFAATIVLFPAGLAVGLLRHRLFDVEVVLGRSLVYGALWLVITLAYAGLAAAFGMAAGAYLPVSWAIIGTLVATLAFQPARQRLQRLADRWVFGEKLGDRELLVRFGALLEHTIQPQDMAPRMAAVIRQGLGVTWVRVAVRRRVGERSALDPVGAAGIDLHADASPVATAALIQGDDQVGIIECGPKEEGQFDARDREILASLGRQAALAMHNARLTTELQERIEEIQQQAQELVASRARLVQAQEDERRRIERDIHDGVQQDIVALLAKIRLARSQLARDPALVKATLIELQDECRQTLADIRELARGIHPPLLSDRGLVEAIEARVARVPIPVAVVMDGLGRGTRMTESIEGAAYFFVCEGLSNVLKHASARAATIRVTATPDNLLLELSDDGCGFAANWMTASGLRGLADRLEALGGKLRVDSQLGRGTRLVASLPVQEYNHA